MVFPLEIHIEARRHCVYFETSMLTSMLGSSLHSTRVFLVTARGLGERNLLIAENIVSMYYHHQVTSTCDRHCHRSSAVNQKARAESMY